MLKEIKNLIFIIVILIFVFFIVKFYFSDENAKKSYRSLLDIDKKIKIYVNELPILENDTDNIIEYVKQTNKQKKKKFNFWQLLEND